MRQAANPAALNITRQAPARPARISTVPVEKSLHNCAQPLPHAGWGDWAKIGQPGAGGADGLI